ncbi:cytochrome P450 [Macroventuria anomochaeta]|uniref:Cytochrome P450 n=1 Tax=Macroventuria anomochaeta TaxID=301207 RepID=A0ACB6RV41_9PLEO|nr:cytochrome P450 [Macroventuria anomochaeta]KAF2625639.1 cytochrome P450 [Macroventuria anomochaeta]
MDLLQSRLATLSDREDFLTKMIKARERGIHLRLSDCRSLFRFYFTRYEDIDAATAVPLKYLKPVAQEAMRVYPPLPFALPHVVPQGGCSHFLMSGTVVSTSTFAASMSTANFSEPWEFKPERWIGENLTNDLDASQPFSYGTRSCMGRSLGWMELHTIMAKIIYRNDMEPVDDNVD